MIIMELNAKARYTLAYALSKSEYNKIYRLKTAKEIWDSLSINCEGIKDVKLRKVTTLTKHYESFSMKEKRVCQWYVWKTSSSSKQSRIPWLDVFKGLDKLEGVRQLSQGVELKTIIIQEARLKESCIG